MPGLGYRPGLWLLGSSDFSAQFAGRAGPAVLLRPPLRGGQHLPALAAYRAAFRPSDALDAPYVMLGVNVLAAEADERARWLAGSGKLAFLRLRTGHPGRYPTPEEAAEYTTRPTRVRS